MSTARINSLTVTCPQCGASVTLPGYADLAECPYCGSNLERTRPLDDGPDTPVPAGAQGAAGTPLTATGFAAGFPVGAAAGATEQVLRSLSCPQCAGPLSVHAGRRILLCAHCGVRVLTHGEGGLSRWVFPQSFTEHQALQAATHWLADYPGLAKRARTISLRNARLVYMPIWEHRALVAGWEFGTKLRTKTYLVTDDQGAERLELALEEERFQDPHLQERRHFVAGCDLFALGAARPRFSGRELLLPLVAGEIDPTAEVMEAQGTAAEVSAKGRHVALQPASGAAAPQTWMLILRESVSLLYYPLWLVDYHAGGQSYRIVIDARTGGVNAATAPARESRFTPLLSLKVAALVVVAVVAIWLGFAWPSVRVPTIFLAAIVCTAAVLLVLRSPAGGKVEYHEPFAS